MALKGSFPISHVLWPDRNSQHRERDLPVTTQPDKSHFLDAQPGEPKWAMIFRDRIIWLDITACENILGLALKMTAVFCITSVQHGLLTGPQVIHISLPPHPPAQKGQWDSHCAELQLHWCTWLQAVGGKRCFSPPSYASLLLGLRTSETNRMVRMDRREVWTQGKDASCHCKS